MAFGAALAGMTAAQLGLLGAGVSAGVPLAARGISALLPAAREQRRLEKKELAEAEKEYERGKRRGFGPGKRKREADVRSRMADYRQQMSGTEDNLRRQEAALGFGRSAALAPVRQRLADAYASTLGKTRAAVESDARKEGEYKERLALSRLNAARGVLAGRAAEQRKFAVDTTVGAVQTGLAVGAQKAAAEEREATNKAFLQAIKAAGGTTG